MNVARRQAAWGERGLLHLQEVFDMPSIERATRRTRPRAISNERTALSLVSRLARDA